MQCFSMFTSDWDMSIVNQSYIVCRSCAMTSLKLSIYLFKQMVGFAKAGGKNF